LDERVVCAACGADNRARARFCRDCGSALPEQEEPASGPPPTQTLSAIPPIGGPPGPRPHGGGFRQPAIVEEIGDGPRRERKRDARLASVSRWRPLAWPAGAVAVAAILVLLGWQLHWPAALFAAKKAPSPRPAALSSPLLRPSAAVTSASTPTASPSSSPVATVSPTASVTPQANAAASTVQAYIAAINAKDYARAWQIAGSDMGTTYADFVSGFKGTEKDTLTILSVTGDVVTVRLSALHTNGLVQVFEGTYTVQNGVIVSTDIQQVS
jgi:hypothetical protein